MAGHARKYFHAVTREWRKLKTTTLSRADIDALVEGHWDRYLADDHLENGNLDIFKKLIFESKAKYAVAKDNYYLGKIDITQYIWQRGLRIGEGMGWYDFRLKDLGLSTKLLPMEDREHFAWKSLKVEREIMPDSLISPDNLENCPEENEQAAALTMSVFFEVIDFYNQNYVPTLSEDWVIRDMAWVELPMEAVAYDEPYLNVTVSPTEQEQFERWRDGRAGPRHAYNIR